MGNEAEKYFSKILLLLSLTLFLIDIIGRQIYKKSKKNNGDKAWRGPNDADESCEISPLSQRKYPNISYYLIKVNAVNQELSELKTDEKNTQLLYYFKEGLRNLNNNLEIKKKFYIFN